MRIIQASLFGLLLSLGVTAGNAQPPTAFLYQGNLEQAGGPADGNYDFQFELYDGPDFLSAISLTGPLTVTDHPVSSGQFAVPVDFGMDVFGGITGWLEVRVRESAAGGALTVLEPRQQLYAVPLAVHALNVAPDVVGGAQIADASVTSADLAPNAVGLTAVDASAVQLRVGDSCAVGSWVRAVNSDGSVVCETDPGGDISSVTAGSGLSGGAVSGNAQLAVDFTQVQARLMGVCPAGQLLSGYDAGGNPVCVAIPIPATDSVVSDPEAAAGSQLSIAIGQDGLPVFAFYGGSPAGVRVVRCNDTACFGDDESDSLVEAGVGVSGIDLIIGNNGFPLLAYAGPSGSAVHVASCNDAACSGGNETISVVAPAMQGGGVSLIADPSGTPALTYITQHPQLGVQLRLVRCNDFICSGNDETPHLVRTVGDDLQAQQRSVIRIGSDNFPLILFGFENVIDDNFVEIIKCNDPLCANGDEEENGLLAVTGTFAFDIVYGSDGLPVIALWDAVQMRFIRCATTDCRFIDSNVVVHNVPSVASYPTIALPASGLPQIAYCSGDGLFLLSCNDLACTGDNESLAMLTTSYCEESAMALGTDNLPVIGYEAREPAGNYLGAYHCAAPRCR